MRLVLSLAFVLAGCGRHECPPGLSRATANSACEVDDPVDTADSHDSPDSGDSVDSVGTNTAPTILVTITESDDGALVCAAITEDADGDELVTTFLWTDGSSSATLPAGSAARLRDWSCTGTTSDGTATVSATAGWVADLPGSGQYRWVEELTFGTPIDMLTLPDGRLLIVEMGGTLSLVDPTVPQLVDSTRVPGFYGLLGMALDPAFGDGTHDWLYVWGVSGVVRFPLRLAPLTLGSEQAVYDPGCGTDELDCSGDMLWWSGEGREVLYITTNQGPNTYHQDSGNVGSKLIAISVDEVTGVGTPAFSVGFEDDFVAAIGLRNPWRLADCGAALCIADPGDENWEEINLYTSAGMNFGWPYEEGMGEGTYADPGVTWQDEDMTWAEDDRTGPDRDGFVNAPGLGLRVSADGYGGRLDGWVLFTDIYDGWVRGLEVLDDGTTSGRTVDVAHQPFISSMAETGGVVYAVDMAGGFYRLALWDDRPTIPALTLADTHFADATPFQVRYELWSDGAEKQRSIWLPGGTTIDTSGAAWEFPEGTEVFKTFSAAGTVFETRMITLSGGHWLGTVFLGDGTTSVRYDGSRESVIALDGNEYPIPGESSCGECHDATRGRAWPLGLNPFVLGDPGLADVAPLLDVPPGPAPDAEGTALDQAARGYLDINCGICHNSTGLVSRVSSVAFNLQYDAPMDLVGQLSLIWETNPNDDAGLPIVDPATPEESVLTRVMESTEMPYLGIQRPDDEAIAELHAWIATLPPS